jgi:hypothetical protein
MMASAPGGETWRCDLTPSLACLGRPSRTISRPCERRVWSTLKAAPALFRARVEDYDALFADKLDLLLKPARGRSRHHVGPVPAAAARRADLPARAPVRRRTRDHAENNPSDLAAYERSAVQAQRSKTRILMSCVEGEQVGAPRTGAETRTQRQPVSTVELHKHVRGAG